MATKKTEEKDLFDLLQNLLKNWYIVLPCVMFAGVVGVFVALWIRPVYQVDALLQIETKNSRFVTKEELAQNDYVINPTRYLTESIDVENDVPFADFIINITRNKY